MAVADHIATGPVGANFNLRTTDADFDIGTAAIGTNNTAWVYVKASGTIATGTCTVASSTFLATDASGAWTADTAFASGEYGWVRKTAQLV